MNTPDWLKIYNEKGHNAINEELKRYIGDRVDVLEYLEREGFQIHWHRSNGVKDAGVVTGGPNSD